MSTTVSLEEASARLAELIDLLAPGDEIIIARASAPVARLIAQQPPLRQPRQPGTLKDAILFMADDFDAPLDDFKEYME
jgi:antitoxin (DNA-binding transcriptional repressor) of toxin-antitoxin stability system